MNIEEKKHEALKEFLKVPENERYKYLIQKGRKLKEMDKNFKIDKYKIKGCQSEVWVYPEFKQGKIYFKFDGEAAVIKGILFILEKIYSGSTPDEILNLNEDFLKESGLIANLSMTRSNGIAQVLRQIKMYALVFKSLNK